MLLNLFSSMFLSIKSQIWKRCSIVREATPNCGGIHFFAALVFCATSVTIVTPAIDDPINIARYWYTKKGCFSATLLWLNKTGEKNY
jgi:hypothetical protein